MEIETSNKINVYYNIITNNKKVAIISATTDFGYAFYAEVTGDDDYFKRTNSLYNNWHKPECYIYARYPQRNTELYCYSYTRYPQRNTELYNGDIDQITKYNHINEIHIVAPLEIVKEALKYWIRCIHIDIADIVFITDKDILDRFTINIDKLLKHKKSNNIIYHKNIFFDLKTLANINTYEDRIHFTNNSVNGIKDNSFYNVNLIKELYTRLKINYKYDYKYGHLRI